MLAAEVFRAAGPAHLTRIRTMTNSPPDLFSAAVDGTTLIVSRGLGGIEVPFRAFAPPDVLIVDLQRR